MTDSWLAEILGGGLRRTTAVAVLLAAGVLSAATSAQEVPPAEDRMLNAGAEALAAELGQPARDLALLRRAAEAAFRAMAAQQWQPIETAPMDRTILLGRVRGDAFDVALGEWEVTDDWPYDGGRWSVSYLWNGKPTHWLEIPGSPASEASAAR